MGIAGYYGKIRDLPARLAIRITMAGGGGGDLPFTLVPCLLLPPLPRLSDSLPVLLVSYTI